MVKFLKEILGKYFVTFDRRMNQYKITVVHNDTGKKVEQWLPEDHFTEHTTIEVVKYCIEELQKQLK